MSSGHRLEGVRGGSSRVRHRPSLALGRRAFPATGTALAAAVATALYAQSETGQRFERWVASRLGVDRELAHSLLERVRAQYGAVEYQARAALFVISVRWPGSAVLPAGIRRRLVRAFVAPMFSAPAPGFAYVRESGRPDPEREGLI